MSPFFGRLTPRDKGFLTANKISIILGDSEPDRLIIRVAATLSDGQYPFSCLLGGVILTCPHTHKMLKWRSHPDSIRLYTTLHLQHNTYDHRVWRTGLLVCSAVLEPIIVRSQFSIRLEL
jgi:hypothetical protein